MGNFNINNNNQDLSYPHHSIYTDILREVTDFFNLELSTSINQVLIRYADNPSEFNSVIDLMFLQTNSKEIDTHAILLDLQSLSNHILLTINIIIRKNFIQDKYQTIIKNSEKEREFVIELKNKVDNIDTTDIPDSNLLEKIIQKFISIIENLQTRYSKCVKITRHFKL